MRPRHSLVSTAAIFLCAVTAHATPILSPYGPLAGYNVVAVGSSAIAGTISVSSDSGRLAASSQILNASSIGPLVNDTFGNPNGYDFVSPGGYTGSTVNVQSSGSAYAPGTGVGRFNFNGGGALVQSGPSPIDFNSVRTSVDSLSASIFSLTGSGAVVLSGDLLTLTGTNTALNVFTVNASQLAAATSQLNINAPAGSTILVNVVSDLGASVAIPIPKLFYNGTQTSGNSTANSNILFNFAQETSAVNFNGQFSGAVLAPFATLTGASQIDGQFIVAAFADSGEVHNVEFTGTLPTFSADPGTTATPEPSSLVLLATGLAAGTAALRRRLPGN